MLNADLPAAVGPTTAITGGSSPPRTRSLLPPMARLPDSDEVPHAVRRAVVQQLPPPGLPGGPDRRGQHLPGRPTTDFELARHLGIHIAQRVEVDVGQGRGHPIVEGHRPRVVVPWGLLTAAGRAVAEDEQRPRLVLAALVAEPAPQRDA